MRYEYKTEFSDIPNDVELVTFEMNAGFWELITVVPTKEMVEGKLTDMFCYWFRRKIRGFI